MSNNDIFDIVGSDALKQKVIQTGNTILEQTKSYSNYSGVTSVHLFTLGASIAGNAALEGAKSTHQLLNNSVSYTLSTVNRYTPDLYDVGHKGQSDLTSEMTSFAAGNTAMIAQNAVRMARLPVSAVLNGTSSVVYSKSRLEKIKKSSEEHLEHSPLAKMKYAEIATGRSSKDIVLNKDRYAWNRFKRNEIANMSAKERATIAFERFRGNRYNRVLSHKKGVDSYSKYLHKKGFSLNRSIRGTIVNQSRKLTNQVISGNDPNSMTNKTLWYANKGVRVGVRSSGKTAQFMLRNRIYVQRFGSALLHPIRTIKHLFMTLISLITSFGTFLSTIPVVVSFIAALLPVIVVCICVVSILTTLFGWYIDSHGYTFHEIKLCDTGNAIKDIANVSAITNKNSQQYKLLFENAFGEVKYDNWGLAYIEEDGERWYCNALATYYNGAIGDKFRVTLESGVQINTILCDIKADAHTHAGNNDPSPACLSADGSMLEFYGHANSVTIPKLQAHGFGSINNNLDASHKWKGPVVKMEKAIPKGGSISGGPNFSNSAAWRPPSNPYASAGLYGQCTWFAWGRFYEIYGFSPGFTGNGYSCVAQLLATHPDKFEFSRVPIAGAVGSSDKAHNHVWIVTGVQGQMITIQEGNLDGATNSWEEGIKDWRTVVYSLSQLQAIYGNISFANPK